MIQGHPRLKKVVLKCQDNFYISYVAAGPQTVYDYTPHVFKLNDSYFDSLIKSQLSEFNNAYCGVRLEKVTYYIQIFREAVYNVIPDKSADQVDSTVRFQTYLWHYNYDGDPFVCLITNEYIDEHQLKYVKRWPKSDHVKHRITWYLKPRGFMFANNFEKIANMKTLLSSQSSSTTQISKCVCFGPVLNVVDKSSKSVLRYVYHCKINCVFHFRFCNPRSKAPGFASGKEKPLNFIRQIKDKETTKRSL